MPFDVIRSEEQREEIVNYLTEEHEKALSEREILERKWIKWRRQGEARPTKESKSYPWKGAANVSVPLTATNTNGIYAALKMAFGTRKPLCTITAEGGNKAYAQHAEAMTRYIDTLIESSRHIGFRKTENTIYRDLALLGTQFVEVPWEEKRWMYKRRDPNTGNLIQVNQLQKRGPSIVPIRIEDFIMRGYFYDPQTAPWYEIRHRFTKHELEIEAALGRFENIEDLEPSEILSDESTERELHRRGIDLKETPLYEIGKFHYFYDVDEDGYPEDIIIWLHVDSGTIVREEFNELGIRNVVRIPYTDIPYQLYALGVGWMCEHLQDEVDVLHNMRIDGTQLSMLQMLIARKGSGVGPEEEVYPLKMFQPDDVKDVNVLKFPDLGPTTVAAESIIMRYAQEYVGTPPASQGQPDPYAKTRATASGTMFLAEQGDRVGASVRDNVSDGLSEIFQMIFFQLVQNRENVNVDMMSVQDQGLIREVLEMNVEDIPHTFNFRVQTTAVEETEQAKKQGMLMLANLYGTYAQQVFQLVPILFNPQVPAPVQELGRKFFTGATEIMDKILKGFGEEDTGKYLPYTEDLKLMHRMIEGMKDQQIGRMLQNVRQGTGMGFRGGAPGPPQGPIEPA